MESQPKNLTAAGIDRISELPDEIVHSIFRHIASSKEIVQTAALSSRWRNLWRSYPVVEFNSRTTESFQQFVDETTKNFSPDRLLRIEALKLSLYLYNVDIRSSYLVQLLDIAATNNAEYIAIKVKVDNCKGYVGHLYPWLPLDSLSNSSARTLHLEKINFKSKKKADHYDLHLSLDSLLHLHLESVRFSNPRLFASLLASSPLLETLEVIRYVDGMRNVNLPNLKTLKIYSITDLELRDWVFMEEFIAPQLNTLEIDNCFYLRLSDVFRAVSKLENLKYLTLTRLHSPEKKLKLSCPKLEELNLWAPYGLEEIELDVKPCFRRFFMHWRLSSPGELKKCEIHNAAVDSRLEVDFGVSMTFLRNSVSHQWFVGFKSFMIRFPQFHAISIACWENCKDGIADHDEPPLSIEHLNIMVCSQYCTDDKGFLSHLFLRDN
ncbi:F-box/FBD/LRR-repeat protein At5g53840 [Linum grandiflorum]